MIIGLTGGIASGKTTVSNFLKDKNYLIYDADKIAKKILEQEEVIKEIILEFGNEVLGKDNKLDRNKIKKIVFSDENKLKKLNNIIHPKVWKFFDDKKEENKKKEKKGEKENVIFDIPLLFESGMEILCDKVILITADMDIKIERIMKRDNIEKELANKIILSQMSDEDKKKKSDIIIENNGNIEKLLEEIERLCEKI